MHIGANGLITFGSFQTLSETELLPCGKHGTCESNAAKGSILAPYLAALNPGFALDDDNFGGSVYFAVTSDFIVVEWDRLMYSTAQAQRHCTVTFEVVLYRGGRVKFQYLDMCEEALSCADVVVTAYDAPPSPTPFRVR
eukprot:SAG22_NODE_7417_length_742_cov_0.842924_1_plen_138_part_01